MNKLFILSVSLFCIYGCTPSQDNNQNVKVDNKQNLSNSNVINIVVPNNAGSSANPSVASNNPSSTTTVTIPTGNASTSPSSGNTSSISSSQTRYKILFTVRDNLSKNPIYSANIDGSLKTKLVQGESNQNNQFPVGSPDGTKIAFNSIYNLYVMNSDGTSNIPIVKSTFYSNAGSPSWSFDGTKIYYNSVSDENGIFSINPDGTQKNKVYQPKDIISFVRISPDGKTLAYISDSGKGAVLTIVGVNGVGETQITDNSKIIVNSTSNICWTPDGKSIIFSGYLPSEQGKGVDRNTDIYQINIDGTGLKKLTDNTGRDDYPSLSPDGKSIVFESKRDEGEGIYTMTSDGKNQQMVVNDHYAGEPSFITVK